MLSNQPTITTSKIYYIIYSNRKHKFKLKKKNKTKRVGCLVLSSCEFVVFIVEIISNTNSRPNNKIKNKKNKEVTKNFTR